MCVFVCVCVCERERERARESEKGGIAQIYLHLQGGKMMMAGGGGAAVDHNGIYSNPNLHSLQQPLMEADNPDSRKRPLETPAEEAGCTKRTNVGGKRDAHQSPAASPPHEVESGVV